MSVKKSSSSDKKKKTTKKKSSRKSVVVSSEKITKTTMQKKSTKKKPIRPVWQAHDTQTQGRPATAKKENKKSVEELDEDIDLQEENDLPEDDHKFVMTKLPDVSDDDIEPVDSQLDQDLVGEGNDVIGEDDADFVIEKKPKRKTEKQQLAEDEKRIDDRLTEIYENTDGSMPDMKTFQKQKHNAFIKAFYVLLFAVLLFGVVAWVGLFVIQPHSQFSENDVVLTIIGDEDVAPGEEVTYRVRYRNAQGVELNDARLEIRYPGGFTFVTSSIPAGNDTNDVWQLGQFEPNGGGYIDITGRFYGDKDEEQSFRAFLNYMPRNFSSEFQTVSHLIVKMGQDIVSLDVGIPDEISVGGEVLIDVTITPVDDNVLQYVQLVCRGDSFTASETSQPEMDEDTDCTWSFDNISGSQQVTFAGSFQSEDISELTIELRGFETEEMKGDGFILTSETIEVEPVQTATSVQLAVNGSVSDSNIAPGEDMITSLVVKNNGEVVMENVEINLMIEAPSYQNRSMLSWTQIDISDEADIFGSQLNDAVRRGTITWDSRYISKLGSLNPGDEVVLDVTLPIKSGSETTLANYDSNTIDISSNVIYTLAGDQKTQETSSITLTLVSDVNLEVRDVASEDVEGNAVHTVTWLLSNSFHDLKDIRLEADFYGDIAVAEEDIVVPAGVVEYDEETKHLTWTIDEMPTSVDVLATQFDITILIDNPSQTQLTSQVKGKAVDKALDTTVHFVGSAIGLQVSE